MIELALTSKARVTMLLNRQESHIEITFQHHEVESQRHESQETAAAAITESEISEGSSVAVNSVNEANATFRDVVGDDDDEHALHGVLVNDAIDGDGDGNGSAEADRLVLEEFFAAMGGPSWVRRDNWLSPLPLGQWNGITADELGRVTGITLGDNRVAGRLPTGSHASAHIPSSQNLTAFSAD